ncbi:polyadenylate-binding protein-interacting protein 12-like [Humulus lupulus]|uniref:polyadenylate-binding protein-interacting protein 12-like n=1 Tax=Humulus lupulus TaxID=3486 RepID=UPI002B409D8C|nr:polyadenylate-binding protein-interacting protein 12-like [Humulus lupulus]
MTYICFNTLLHPSYFYKLLQIIGDSIYNLTRLGEGETDKNDRPLDPPPKILSVEELSTSDTDNKDTKKKAIKKLNLLSFGEEAEEKEKELAAVKKKIKSSHDVLDDPRLLNDAIPNDELFFLSAFISIVKVVDCRICGDPNSVLRFVFIEFTDEEGARAALSLAGTMLGFYLVRVLPSKTAIAPVNPTFLPRTNDEREMCARTIYCTNVDKKVAQADVKLFFESVCGEVYRLRLLGDYHHSTRIAFVEFVMVSICFNIPTFNILCLCIICFLFHHF